MIADANLHVWLEANTNARPGIVTPYVESSESARIHYSLSAIKDGRSGSSRISQSGTVTVPAKKPTALSQLSLGAGKHDACRIELILTKGGMPAGTYHFDCPR
ncbi:hypothetical protein LSG25_01745 [Paralcaligenes sp. KSB-10]|uniref:curli-like amyloid fiber formation chaperone CsgH n=1 Tax=Paralcaligenes sp. KSB-10 TaxID=2901142 RepID=UPI001E3A0612|nr:curli-like amyloid fiber formation chaperone CsgH [Paralcaligenes sp. KSB-10]UHL64656.1 hypothetical protein LSG25_01745 [Paralcaligenes sp. KSB-10]